MEQSVANLVDMRDVSFTRGNRCIFDNISLTVPRGKITAIMGPSGIGKTTLLRLIGGQIAPDHGEIDLIARMHNIVYAQQKFTTQCAAWV